MEPHDKNNINIHISAGSAQDSSASTGTAALRRNWDPPALKRVWEAPALSSIPLDAAETGILFGPEMLILLS